MSKIVCAINSGVNVSFYHSLFWSLATTSFQSIEKKYDISGIPTLVVIRVSDSHTLTMDGVEEVQEKGKEAVNAWN